MAKYTLEQIDYLREKASITYEEALETLERFDGDLAHCLVDLERKGRIKPPQRKPGATAQNYRYEYRYDRNEQRSDTRSDRAENRGYDARRFDQQHRGKAFVLDGEWLKQALFSHVVVRKDERIVADLPVIFVGFAACAAPHLVFASVLLIFLMGYRVKWERLQEKPKPANDLFAFVDKTAENIRRTADSFVRTVKNEVYPQPTQPEAPARPAPEAPNHDPEIKPEIKPEPKAEPLAEEKPAPKAKATPKVVPLRPTEEGEEGPSEITIE